MDNMNSVFVYGTLKKGFNNDHLLKGEELIGEAKANGLRMFVVGSGLYPAVIKSDPTDVVHGEVYRVNDEVLKRLDRLEGVPSLYTRDLIKVKMDSGETRHTFVYLGNGCRENFTSKVKDGIWKCA